MPNTIKNFITKWTGRGNEIQDTSKYWIDLLSAIGVSNPTDIVNYEKYVFVNGKKKRIDVFMPDTKVLVEQKSLNIDLDKPELQSDGAVLTPYEQGKRYSDNLPFSEKPSRIIVCNFKEIRIHDMNQMRPELDPVIIKLEDLEKEAKYLDFLKAFTETAIRKEEQISVDAGNIVKKLYNLLLAQYADPDDPETLKSLNILCVRLVFMMYCEDSGIFEQNQFKNYAEYSVLNKLRDAFKESTVTTIVETAKERYGDDMKAADKKFLERDLNNRSDKMLNRIAGDYEITKKEIESERKKALQSLENWGQDAQKVNEEFDQKQKDAAEKLKADLTASISEFVEDASKDVVKHVETRKREREKDVIEDTIRDHLRGFSRTIPSFLMAYGDDSVTLATFDEKVPGEVFVEVTSITLDQFKFLRDGGEYIDTETGEQKHFAGNLFDPVVFDDSVREFLRLKKKLADYFDEKAIEDIFDYIPPQKTNQIYTPKDVVKKMVDMLEDENPGCFDTPDKTFIDLYMKSGLYITEIVKRLYQSDEMKKQFPDGKERLKHIFENQVYGLAPTEIIYKIATNYILGFDENVEIEKHNFRQVDALPYAKAGTLNELLDELFG